MGNFCWKSSQRARFCLSRSNTSIFSLMHSSLRSWWDTVTEGQTRVAAAAAAATATYLLVEQSLDHVIGHLETKDKVKI